jgi:hypothetical protein
MHQTYTMCIGFQMRSYISQFLLVQHVADQPNNFKLLIEVQSSDKQLITDLYQTGSLMPYKAYTIKHDSASCNARD